jgi:DNA-binding Xre family transcriptional regulator
MAWRCVVSPMRDLAQARGIQNVHQLSKLSGLSWNTVDSWWNGESISHIELSVLFAFCKVLECAPNEIINFEYIDE